MDRHFDPHGVGDNGRVGDRVIHVVPPPDEDKDVDVYFGPVLITPEIIWPEGGKPGSPSLPGSPGRFFNDRVRPKGSE
ncbi:hypothetical protein [Desulfonatronum thioautotrophicum]|uniref:hypothetical protein n=1 Tax=Desulfonatronum thioautotrophicum TaxID=617001 RepID=UPI0012948671|nr:hypothetical protein [Desulfonatronum thioautotrophicum]